MSDIPADEIKIEVWPIPGIHERGGQHLESTTGSVSRTYRQAFRLSSISAGLSTSTR